MTTEGVYANVINTDSCDKALSDLTNTMSVYKDEQKPIVTELTDSVL